MRGLATATASSQQAAATPAPRRPDDAEQEGFYGTPGPNPFAGQPAGKTQRPAAVGRNPAWQRSKQLQLQRSREPSAAPPKRNAEVRGARGTGEVRLVLSDSSHEVLTVKAALQRAKASNMDLVSIRGWIVSGVAVVAAFGMCLLNRRHSNWFGGASSFALCITWHTRVTPKVQNGEDRGFWGDFGFRSCDRLPQ